MTVEKFVFVTAAALTRCTATALTAAAEAPRKLIPVEEFTLANGMKVIFHMAALLEFPRALIRSMSRHRRRSFRDRLRS